MITLTSTLKAAQQGYDVLPVVKVMVSDNPPEAPRLSELASVYTANEPDGVFDVTWTDNGYIGRVYIDPSTGNVFAQVNPANAAPSQWTTYTRIATGAYHSGGGACCCSGFQNGSGDVWFMYVDGTGYQLQQVYYTASSKTFGAPYLIYNQGPGYLIQSIAADGQDPTQRVIFAVAGDQIKETHWNGSVWTAPVGDGRIWTNPNIAYGFRPTTAPNGDGNGYVLVTSGSPAQVVSIEQFVVSSASWGVKQDIQAYGTGTGYSCGYPKMQETRADSRRAVYGWMENGPAAYGNVPITCFSPSHIYPTSFVPWPYSGSTQHGLKVMRSSSTAFGGPYWWVCASDQLYQCPADNPAVRPVQRASFAESDIEAVRIDLPGMHRPGVISVQLSNEGGKLAGAGVVGNTYQALRRWSQVVISLGYHTTAGDEYVYQAPCWIEQVIFEDDPASGVPLVTLHCTDCWGILEHLRFRWSQSVANDNPADLAAKILYWVAGDLTWNGSSEWSGFNLTTFTYRAGESLAGALRRLLDLSGDVLVFRTFATSADGSGWDSVQILTPKWASGATAYSYQQFLTSQADPTAGAHPILHSRVAPYVIPSATSVEVVGASTTTVRRDWTTIWDLWHDVGSRVVDKTLGAQASTDQVAGNMLSYLVPERWGGEFTALANVGLEIGDRLSVTVPTAPVNAMAMTVAGIVTSWDRKRGTILQTVMVEGTN